MNTHTNISTGAEVKTEIDFEVEIVAEFARTLEDRELIRLYEIFIFEADFGITQARRHYAIMHDLKMGHDRYGEHFDAWIEGWNINGMAWEKSNALIAEFNKRGLRLPRPDYRPTARTFKM